MALSLARLRAIRSVAEAGSYAAAARALGLSPPAVSQQVREVEAEYGVRLFTRERGVLRATPVCDCLSELAGRIAIDREEAERLLTRHASHEHGHLAVGLGNTMPGMALVAAFHREHPRVSLRVESGSHERIMRAVLNREVDVGVLPGVRDTRLRAVPLLRNEVVALAPPASPLWRRSAVGCADLARHPLIFRSRGSSTQRVVDRAFRAAGLEPRPLLTLDTRDGVYEAVANGLGVGFMWRFGTGRRDTVRRLTFSDGAEHEEVAFALAEDCGPLAGEFLDTARGAIGPPDGPSAITSTE